MTQLKAMNLRFAENGNTQDVKNAREERLGGFYCVLKARKMLESKVMQSPGTYHVITPTKHSFTSLLNV